MTEFLTFYRNLPAAGGNGRARRAALEAAAEVEVDATSIIDYRSAGYLLIIGREVDGLGCADQLRGRLHCTVLAPGPHAGRLPEEADRAREDQDRVLVIHGEPVAVEGHLGRFAVNVRIPEGREINLAELIRSEHPFFDLVLDLRRQPGIRLDLPPLGYYAPAGDSERLAEIVTELPEMVGEFEKPVFLNYDPDICAHSRSRLSGCSRCLDTCPTGAITSLGDLIEVDTYLCQGGGSCATACPSGALTYAYPSPRDQLVRVRHALRAYYAAGGEHAALLFHDDELGSEWLQAAVGELPEHIIPVPVDEIGAVGMDIWLAALAYGAGDVLLLDTPEVADSVRQEILRQIAYTRPLLEAMGHAPDRLRLLAESDGPLPARLTGMQPHEVIGKPATFATSNEKRGTLRLAINHLYEQALQSELSPALTVDLPVGAPFGRVLVDAGRCTLCMACPQVCPTRAITDAGDQPQLDFTEENCVQCGLCEKACPEDAITLQPRFHFDREQRRSTRVLNREEPFLCIGCGKPFATASVIARMTDRLQGHHMFQTEDSMRRLKMCGDCRVVDMFAEEAGQGSRPTVYGMESNER